MLFVSQFAVFEGTKECTSYLKPAPMELLLNSLDCQRSPICIEKEKKNTMYLFQSPIYLIQE